MSPRRVLGTVVAAVLAGGVVACSGSGPAGPSPSPVTVSVTSRPTTSATVPLPTASGAPPTVPVTAQAHTAAGAEAFVRFYFDVVNRRATVTPKLDCLGALSDAGCHGMQEVGG